VKLLNSYRQIFALPKFGSSLAAAAAAKLKVGLSSVALLLEVAHYRGLPQAAIVVSISALAGVTVPLRGRLMDRYSYALVMCPTLVLYLGALTVLVLNEAAHGAFAITLVAAFVASAAIPPIQIVTRLMWREMTAGELRTTILSLDAMLTDLGFIVGPTIGAFLVVVVAPWAALAASALLSTVSTLLLLSRRLPHQGARPKSAERRWLGLLHDRVLRRTMATAVFFALAIRAIEFAFPAWAQQHDEPLMSGILLSCMGVGSVAGGLAVGGLSAHRSVRVTLPATLAALSLGTLLVAGASYTWTVLLIAAAAVMGIAVGPSFMTLYATAGDLAPTDMAAETQSWISSFMSLGGVFGTSTSGLAVRAFGPGAVLLLAAGSLAVGSVLAHLAVKARPLPPAQEQMPLFDTVVAVSAED
jgi:MFS family permease